MARKQNLWTKKHLTAYFELISMEIDSVDDYDEQDEYINRLIEYIDKFRLINKGSKRTATLKKLRLKEESCRCKLCTNCIDEEEWYGRTGGNKSPGECKRRLQPKYLYYSSPYDS